MPAPAEHLLFGGYYDEKQYSGLTKTIGGSILLVLLVVGPDLDIVISYIIIGNSGYWHREFTHSLLFAYLCGIAIPPLLNYFRLIELRYQQTKAINWLLSWTWETDLTARKCMALVYTHIFFDYVLAPSPTALFWPYPTTQPWPYHWLVDYVLPYDWQRPVGDTITAILFSCFLWLLVVHNRNKTQINGSLLGESFSYPNVFINKFD